MVLGHVVFDKHADVQNVLAEGLVFVSQYVHPAFHVVLIVEVFAFCQVFAESYLLFLMGFREDRQ